MRHTTYIHAVYMVNFLPLLLLFCHPFFFHSLWTTHIPSPSSTLSPRAFYQQHGYTVVVDGWSGGEAVPAGPYLLRVVSSSPNLPQREQVNRASQNGAPPEKLTSSFTANSIQQYYLPDRDLRIFRYPIPTHLRIHGPPVYVPVHTRTYRTRTLRTSTVPTPPAPSLVNSSPTPLVSPVWLSPRREECSGSTCLGLYRELLLEHYSFFAVYVEMQYPLCLYPRSHAANGVLYSYSAHLSAHTIALSVATCTVLYCTVLFPVVSADTH